MKDLSELESLLERKISLQDAYRVMEHFIGAYLARGDTSVSDFLYCYVGLTEPGRTTDPAAIYDFLESAQAALALPPTGAGASGA